MMEKNEVSTTADDRLCPCQHALGCGHCLLVVGLCHSFVATGVTGDYGKLIPGGRLLDFHGNCHATLFQGGHQFVEVMHKAKGDAA